MLCRGAADHTYEQASDDCDDWGDEDEDVPDIGHVAVPSSHLLHVYTYVDTLAVVRIL
jgi:hypothetical protein